jgi:hypothetical protein
MDHLFINGFFMLNFNALATAVMVNGCLLFLFGYYLIAATTALTAEWPLSLLRHSAVGICDSVFSIQQ